MTRQPQITPSEIEVQQATRTVLPNGVALYTLPADEFEVLRISFVFRAGSSVQQVPFSASAAANLLAEGSEAMTAAEIAEQLDYHGSWYDVNIDRDYAYINFATLSKFFAETLAARPFPRRSCAPMPPSANSGWPSTARRSISRPAKRSPGRCSGRSIPTASRRTRRPTTG